MLIGLHGKMGSGKDAAYERMLALGLSPIRIGFADKLKVSAMASLGFRKDALGKVRSDAELINLANSLKDSGIIAVSLEEDFYRTISGREYLQFKGTEGGRDVFGDDFWVDQALSAVAPDTDDLYVCTDVRFPNEAEAIRELGGSIWRVVGCDEDTGSHPSETPLPDELISVTIDNTIRDDDFASLDAQIQQAIKEWA